MNPTERLMKWGRWLHSHPVNCHPSVTVLWRVIHERAGASSCGTPGDGGLGALYDRTKKMLHYDMEGAETHRMIGRMRREYRELVYATFAGPPGIHLPRSGRAAAAILGISMNAYWKLRERLIDWMNGSKQPTDGIDKAA